MKKQVKILLQNNAHCLFQDDLGPSALHIAADENFHEMAKELLKFDESLKIIKNNNGYTPMDIAKTKKHLKSIKEIGGDLELKNFLQNEKMEKHLLKKVFCLVIRTRSASKNLR